MSLWTKENTNRDVSEEVKSEDGKGLEGIDLVAAGSDEHRSAALRHLVKTGPFCPAQNVDWSVGKEISRA